MRIILAPKAQKQLDKLPPSEAVKVTKHLHVLEFNPFAGKKLSGEFDGTYALKIWPYRAIYTIYKNKGHILVENIEHRQGVYK